MQRGTVAGAQWPQDEAGGLDPSGDVNEEWIHHSKVATEECARFIRDAGDLVRGLTIELEVELGFGSTVVPFGKELELAPPKAPFCECGTSDNDTHPRRLPGDPPLPCHRFGRGDDAARHQTRPALVLAREDEDGVALGDVLAAIHRLLRVERERLRSWVADGGFDH